jgi:hypothetical protein
MPFIEVYVSLYPFFDVRHVQCQALCLNVGKESMGVPTEVLQGVIMQRKMPHKARHKLPVLLIGNNDNSILCTPGSKLNHAKNK